MKHVSLSLLLVTALVVAPLAAQEPPPADESRSREDRVSQLFQLPGVDFTAEQQKSADQLRAKYEPKLRDLQQQMNSLETREQREGRRQALETARQQGKNRR